MHVGLFFGILLITCSYAQGSSTTSVPDPVTSVGTSEATSGTAEPAGSTTGGSTGSAGTAATSGGSTGTAVPSTAPQSTVTTTPGTTTLPKVNVKNTQFQFIQCDADTCTYKFSAPANNQRVLATEQAAIDGDRGKYQDLKNQADQQNRDINKANDDAVKKIRELQATLDAIVGKLGTIKSNIDTIQRQQLKSNIQLKQVEQFIDQVTSQPTSCLYRTCLTPTTPPPTTTTPPPPPTTTPSKCETFDCPGDTSCEIDSSGTPFCKNCPGDLDGYSKCVAVTCSASGSDFKFSGDGSTKWYSYGYNDTDKSSSAFSPNSNCVWNLPGSLGFDLGDYNITSITEDITLTIVSDAFTQRIRNTLSKRQLVSMFKSITTNAKITLTTTKTLAPTSGYSFFALTPIVAPSGANGFRDWLFNN